MKRHSAHMFGLARSLVGLITGECPCSTQRALPWLDGPNLLSIPASMYVHLISGEK